MTAPPDIDALWNFADPSATRASFHAILAAHPDAPAPWRAEVLTQIARTHSLTRAIPAADALLDEAESLLAAAPEPRTAARIALERGRTRRSSGDPDAARPLFLQALTRANEAGDDHLAIDAIHMLAIVAPPDEALRLNEDALARAEASIQPRGRRWRASLLNNLGWTHHDAGRPAEAHALFVRATAARREQGDLSGERIALWCEARALRSLGRIDEAFRIQISLLDHAEPGDEGHTEEELGELHALLGDPAAARAQLATALDKARSHHDPDRIARLEARVATLP